MNLRELLKAKGTKHQRVAEALAISCNGSLSRRINMETINLKELRILRKYKVLSSEDILLLTKTEYKTSTKQKVDVMLEEILG